MKILLDAIPLTGLLTGISRYVRNLYFEMEKLPGVEVHYFDGRRIHRKMPRQADPGKWAKTTGAIWNLPDVAVLALRTVNWLLYEYKLKRRIACNAYDLHHETAFTPAAQSGCPQVFTLHDLSLMRYPETHPKERVWFSDLFFKRRIGYSSHTITVSEFIKGEICNLLTIDEDCVTAIPEAADPFFYPRKEHDVTKAKRSLGLPENFLLTVGTLEPRKNLSTLVEALKVCKNTIPLVMAGWSGWGEKSWMKNIASTDVMKRIHLPGYVDEETLACLYTGARAFVYPSLYEGFGLPVLEAMACGAPVICSNAASLPEVSGDAALLVSPKDVEGMASAIDSLWQDTELRRKKTLEGKRRSNEFSWSRTAFRTHKIFKEIARR